MCLRGRDDTGRNGQQLRVERPDVDIAKRSEAELLVEQPRCVVRLEHLETHTADASVSGLRQHGSHQGFSDPGAAVSGGDPHAPDPAFVLADPEHAKANRLVIGECDASCLEVEVVGLDEAGYALHVEVNRDCVAFVDGREQLRERLERERARRLETQRPT